MTHIRAQYRLAASSRPGAAGPPGEPGQTQSCVSATSLELGQGQDRPSGLGQDPQSEDWVQSKLWGNRAKPGLRPGWTVPSISPQGIRREASIVPPWARQTSPTMWSQHPMPCWCVHPVFAYTLIWFPEKQINIKWEDKKKKFGKEVQCKRKEKTLIPTGMGEYRYWQFFRTSNVKWTSLMCS